jgi:hypothetical protein
MPKATKIVIEFDDGSRYNVDPAQAGSIFTNEAAAKKCGHHPPYGKPPQSGNGNGTDTLSVTSDSTAAATTEGPTCYWVNGIIVCP